MSRSGAGEYGAMQAVPRLNKDKMSIARQASRADQELDLALETRLKWFTYVAPHMP